MCIRDSIVSSKALPLGAAVFTLPLFWSTGMMLSLIHISEPTRLLSISYAVFCLKKQQPPPRSTRVRSSAASDVYKRQHSELKSSATGCSSFYTTPLLVYRHDAVSYTHLRAHETPEHLVCRLLLEKATATTEIYTRKIVGSVRCV